jgi:hypothetical protein
MTRLRISLGIGAAALGLILAVVPARALNLISYVSELTGNNANSCASPAAPCQHIDIALFKTEAGGEIKCLDDHRDGPITITKPITIDCGAPNALIAGLAGGPAVMVDLDEATYPDGVVTLRNLSINGFLGNGLVPPGGFGIRVSGGGAAVHVENSTITGFTKLAIEFRPTSSADLFIRNTTISNNQTGGVWVVPTAAASVRGSLSDVSIEGNGGVGVAATKSSGAGEVVITVEDTRIQRNSTGLSANGAAASILLAGSTVAHNTRGLRALNSGTIVSSGNNTIFFNTNNGAPTSTVPLN